MDRPTCGTCPFWNDISTIEDEDIGECKRCSPRLATLDSQLNEDEMARQGLWPITEFDEWCGEHPDFPAYAAGFAIGRAL
jgi:hypothetical protein